MNIRKISVGFLALVMVAATQAASFSRSSGGIARSSGISRPAATQAARAPAPAPVYRAPTPAPTYTPPPPVYRAPPPPVYAPAPAYRPSTSYYDSRRYNNGPSAGQVAGAAAAGAAGGVILGNVLSNGIGGQAPVVINNGGGGTQASQAPVAPSAAPQAAPDQWGATPVYQAPQQASGGFWSGVWTFVGGVFQFLLLIILAFAAYLGLKKAYSMYQSRKASNNGVGPFAASWAGGTASTDANLAPVAKFMQVQRAFAGHDMEALRGLLGPNLIETVNFEGKPGLCTVVNAQATKVFEDSDEVSYRMTALDTEDNSKIDEVWHFVKIGSQWKLDGIEQM